MKGAGAGAVDYLSGLLTVGAAELHRTIYRIISRKVTMLGSKKKFGPVR
jgi:hypothetical protein